VKYLLPITIALVSLPLLVYGYGASVSAGICDTCSGNQTPGTVSFVAGVVCLLASVVAAAWVRRKR
jgi:hypothetical protein